MANPDFILILFEINIIIYFSRFAFVKNNMAICISFHLYYKIYYLR